MLASKRQISMVEHRQVPRIHAHARVRSGFYSKALPGVLLSSYPPILLSCAVVCLVCVELQAEQTTLTLLKSLLKLKRSALLSDPL